MALSDENELERKAIEGRGERASSAHMLERRESFQDGPRRQELVSVAGAKLLQNQKHSVGVTARSVSSGHGESLHPNMKCFERNFFR